MELVPEWAPNIHPMIVHFPIAILLAAIGADLLGERGFVQLADAICSFLHVRGEGGLISKSKVVMN